MTNAASQHLARLLGYPAGGGPTGSELERAVAEAVEQVAAGLAAEALASDDVQSGAEARAFVEERLGEWAEVLSRTVRHRIAGAASVEIQRRAPDA